MRKLAGLFVLALFAGVVRAQPVAIDCAPSTPCTVDGPSGTGTGDPAYAAFGKTNANFTTLWGLVTTSPNGSITFGGTLGSGMTAVVNVPDSLPVIATSSSGQLIAASVSGTGNTVALVNSPTLVAPQLGQPTALDALYATDLQTSALVGPVLPSQLLGVSIRYPNASTDTILSSDLLNVVANQFCGATETIPDATASGFGAGYSVGVYNACASQSMTIVRTSTSTINFGTSITVPAQSGVVLYADSDNSGTGNYNYVAFAGGSGSGGGATLSANTFTGTQTISMSGPNMVMADTASGANGGKWNFYSNAASGNFCISAINDALSQNHNGICFDRGTDSTAVLGSITIGSTTDEPLVNVPGGLNASGLRMSSTLGAFTVPAAGFYSDMLASNVAQFGTASTPAFQVDGLQNVQLDNELISTIQPGQSYPAITWSGSGCTGQPTDTTVPAISGTFTASSATITATNTFSNGLAVTLINPAGSTVPVPAPYANGTLYYIINETGTSFQLSLTSGGSSVGVVTGATTSGITIAVAGNYLHEGGLVAGNWTVPTTGTYVTACIMTMTWPNSSIWGKKCRLDDETQSSNMTQAGHTPRTGSFVKASAVAPGDVISYLCGAY